jgi:hypothetical protein
MVEIKKEAKENKTIVETWRNKDWAVLLKAPYVKDEAAYTSIAKIKDLNTALVVMHTLVSN